MIARKLVDHTNIGRAIDRILNMVYAPSVSMRDSIGSATSFFYTSMIVHPGSDDHFRIRKLIHEGLLSSLSEKQKHGTVSLNNVALGFNYKLSINMLMKNYTLLYDTFIFFIQLIWKKIIKLSTHQLQLQKVSTSQRQLMEN